MFLSFLSYSFICIFSLSESLSCFSFQFFSFILLWFLFQFQDFHFLCPNDTVFDQQHLVCTNWFEVDCHAQLAVSEKATFFQYGGISTWSAPTNARWTATLSWR
jgi:hypothetical protein